MRARAILLAAGGLFAVLAFGFQRPSTGVALRDFEAYYAAGATQLTGADPYSLAVWQAEERIPGIVEARRELLPFFSPPATLPLWSALARTSFTRASIVWIAVLVCSLMALIAATAALLRLSQAQTAATALLAIAFVPVTSAIALGQAALPAFAAVVMALALLDAWPVLASAAAIAAALQPNVALPLALGFTTRRGAGALLCAAAAAYVCGAAVSGAAWIVPYLRVLAAASRAEGFAAIQYTPAAIFYGFGLTPPVAIAAAAITAAVAAVVAVRGASRTSQRVKRIAIVCAAMPFVAGFFHDQDMIVLFFPATAALCFTRTRAPLAFLGALLASVNWVDFAQQPQGAAQDCILALAFAAFAAALRPSRALLMPAFAFGGCVLAGAWIGHLHPLPIWPDAMHGAPALSGTPAEIWKEEQLQTGLLRPDAAAALLRMLALLGAALLLYASLDIDVHHVIERRDRVRVEVL